jgi:hypothetical protein
MAAVADPYATVAAGVAPVAGPVPAAEMTGVVPAAAHESFPQAGMCGDPIVSAAPLNPAGGGEVDKVSLILAVVSFLIVVGMVVVLAMMTVE